MCLKKWCFKTIIHYCGFEVCNTCVLPRNLDRTSHHDVWNGFLAISVNQINFCHCPTVRCHLSTSNLFQITGPWGMGNGLNFTERDAVGPDPGELNNTSKSDHFAGEKKGKQHNMNLVVVEHQVMPTPSFSKYGKLLEVFHEFPSINLTSPSSNLQRL